MLQNTPSDFAGKPPKSSAEIRPVLKQVHGANAEAASDIPQGRAEDDVATLMPVAEFRRRHAARQLAWRLERRKIPSRIVRRGGHWFVQVFAVHFDEALLLVAESRRESQHDQIDPTSSNANSKAEYSSAVNALRALFYFIFLLLGAGVGRAAWGDPSPSAPPTAANVAAVLSGALVGVFTWWALESVIRSVVLRTIAFARKFATAKTEKPAELEVDTESCSTWSTHLTNTRNRKKTPLPARDAWHRGY